MLSEGPRNTFALHIRQKNFFENLTIFWEYGPLKKVPVVSDSPNVSKVISPNASEVVESTVSEVDRQLETSQSEFLQVEVSKIVFLSD